MLVVGCVHMIDVYFITITSYNYCIIVNASVTLKSIIVAHKYMHIFIHTLHQHSKWSHSRNILSIFAYL